MKLKQLINIKLKLLSLIAFLLFSYGCNKLSSPGDLIINQIEYTEIYANEILDLPDGAYIPDNPDFDIDNPETWTGNMAQYVSYNYVYSVSYQISNTGGSIAYDTEIDLYYSFNKGEEIVETIYIGDINPNKTINKSTNIACTNKQLIECGGDVFWFD